MIEFKTTVAGVAAVLVLVVIVLGCDSPPWSRFIVANSSSGSVTVRFYTEYPTMASPYLYSKEEWAADAHFSSGTPRERFVFNEEEHFIEAIVEPGAAVEIDRAPYTEIEKNPDTSFLIDRLEITGPSGNVSFDSRRKVFQNLERECDLPICSSPRFVYYYK